MRALNKLQLPMAPRKKNNQITSKDVARSAGVSQSAVSRTFTPGASVSAETREKVLAAARGLGYRPNFIARSLNRQSTRLIGIVMLKIQDPFYARMLNIFTQRLQEKGYWSLLLKVDDTADLEETLPKALQYQVDGIVLTSATLSSSMASHCASMGVPVVLANRTSLDVQVNAVSVDHAGGARLLGDLLCRAGHRRIAYMSGEETSSTNRERERGFGEKLAEYGLKIWRRAAGDYSYASGYEGVAGLFKGPRPPDALFCANDFMAMGAMDRLRGLGIKVPQEVSIVGFDDVAMAAWPQYNLTTIHQPLNRLVEVTIDVLLEAMASPEAERTIRILPATLVTRGSARLPQENSGDFAPPA
jgi:DNA-binding LacI/PurR family transcriptional regulator